ncbi:MAG: hypothetical protein ABIH59_01515 [archaeon]
MKTKNLLFAFGILFLINLGFVSALVVDAEYITLFPGEEGKVRFEIENNENFDIEDISVQILLGTILPDGSPISLPFTIVGSSEKDIEDIRKDKDESVSFDLKASTEITPRDYNIPYLVKYFDEDDKDTVLEKTGTFGLRVSAKTELDFTVEVKGNAIVGEEGKVSLEIINKGLGNIKSVSVQIFPQGFELLSKDKIFVGTIDADDTDLASFDVIYKTKNPSLKAKIEYKDFDNEDHTETIELAFKVYTKEEALKLGIIKKSNTLTYVIIIIVLIVAWIIYRKIKKRKNKKGR